MTSDTASDKRKHKNDMNSLIYFISSEFHWEKIEPIIESRKESIMLRISATSRFDGPEDLSKSQSIRSHPSLHSDLRIIHTEKSSNYSSESQLIYLFE